MIINTKEVKKGIVTVNGHSINNRMEVSEFKNLLSKNGHETDDMDSIDNYVFSGFEEDGKKISLRAGSKDDKICCVVIQIHGFSKKEKAVAYIEDWLKTRNLQRYGRDICGEMYETDCGFINISYVRSCKDPYYTIEVKLNYEEPPRRIFPLLQEDLENTVMDPSSTYKYQRVKVKDMKNFPVFNFLNEGPTSLSNWCAGKKIRRWTENDRIESVYIAIINKNNPDKIVGVAVFTYMAVLDVLESGKIVVTLDEIDVEKGCIGVFLDKKYNSLEKASKISPFLLILENVQGEMPENPEYNIFLQDEKNIGELYRAASMLVSKYVGVQKERITNISATIGADSLFHRSEKMDGVNINYGFLASNTTTIL